MKKIILLISLVPVQILYAQLVECKLMFCGLDRDCYYDCSDKYPRQSKKNNERYSCENMRDLFDYKPDCQEIYAEIRREHQEKIKRQAENEERYAQEKGKRCDKEQAWQFSICLSLIGQHYINMVNDYLVNGQNTPLISKIDFNSGRDSINAYGNCFDYFSYKDIAKGRGLEISLAEAGTKSCVAFEGGKDRSSCKKGMKILLKTSLKNGKQDKIADECDFWNDCEKVDGPVIESASWEIPGKTNCDAELREKMKEKILDTRKHYK